MSSPSHSDTEGSASKRKRTKPWSSQEDLLVRELVKKHGGSDEELATLSSANIKWLTIGSLVPGRTGKQCRERWHNLLNPQVNKQSWSPEEDSLIVSCLQTMGTKWSDIAKMMTGRTDNAIKNRWYSTVRRVERYKRAGQHKSMFATPTDIRKNNNPLFHFCLASFSLGKKNMASFGPGEMGGVPTTAAAATGANGTPTQATLATPADSNGTSNNWLHMQQLNGQSLGGDSTTVSLSYPSMTNVTVASAVDAVELNAALQTPTRPTSRANTRTPASQAGDSSSASPLFANALSARRCITPPQMLALPTSPPLPFQNIRNGSAAGSKRKSGAAAKAAANSSKKQKAANGTAIKTEGGDAGTDALPLQMQVEFVQSVSEEARQLQYEMVSPQSSKLLSVPNSTLQSPPSNASTPSPLSHNTPGSISPFSALSPCFPLPPTPPTYASPPNTSSATTSASSHATSSYTLLHGNSTTFPMPSPAANGNLSQQFQNAASAGNAQNGNSNGTSSAPLPPQAPQTPSAYTTFLNSPLPNGRPTLSSGLSGMGTSTTGGSFSPSTMLQFGQPTPGVTGPGGDSGPFSHFMSLQTPSVGGSFSSSFPLASPALQGQQSYGSTSFPLPSPAVGGGLGLSSPGPFPMTSPFLRQNSSVTGPYSSGLGGPKSARKSFDATAAIANYNAAAAATNAAVTTTTASTTLGVRATEKKKK